MNLFEKLDKNIEIGNNEWHGAPFGEIETEPRNLSLLHICQLELSLFELSTSTRKCFFYS
jgi:hypothetical protein